MEAALRLWLMGLDVVKATAADRIFPNAAPQKAPFPRIVYQVLGGETIETQDGPLSLVNDVVQINCWAEKYSDASAMAAAIAAAAKTWSGDFAGVTIEAAFAERPRALQDEPLPGAERGPAAKSIALKVWHRLPG